MISWSYSHYSMALRCLQLYKHVVIDGTPSPVPDSADLRFGSALHSAINSILYGDDGESTFEIYWNSEKNKDLQYGRYGWKELNELGLNFCSKFRRLHAKKYKVEQAEVRLYGEYKGVKLEGTFDFYGQYDGRTSLRDFKSSGYNYDKARSVIGLQLYLYAYLSSTGSSNQVPQTLGYTVFNKGTGSIQDLTWDFSEKDMYKALDHMIEYVNIVSKQNTWPKNYASCLIGKNKCQYFSICHKGKDAKE